MKISPKKTIRPTALQPQLFSVIKYLTNHDDYRLVVNKDNEPVCVMISYSLAKRFPFQEEAYKKWEQDMVASMKAYYADMPEDEKNLVNEGIDDVIDY